MVCDEFVVGSMLNDAFSDGAQERCGSRLIIFDQDGQQPHSAGVKCHACMYHASRNESLRPLMISSEGIVMPST